MRRILLLLLMVLAAPLGVHANEAWHDWCWNGNQPVITQGLTSSTLVQASSPLCTVSVFVHGGGLATLFSDNAGTPLANPFTAQTNGQILWYAANGNYDETLTLTINGQTQSVTLSNILLCDPFASGSSCGGGGGGGGHNLLSTTHLDTVPASPPSRGDLITAQSLTSPSGVNPAWARLPLGGTLQVLKSNGTDVVWNYALTILSGGTSVSTRSQLNFLPGTNTSYVLADDPAVNSADVTVNAFEQYAHNGTLVSARPIANFNDTGTVTFTLADNPANNRVDISATGGGGSSVSITATGPIVVTPTPLTGTGVISCPTCFATSSTLVRKFILPYASCLNGVAASAWDTPTSSAAVAACVTDGTNGTVQGTLQYQDGQIAYYTVIVPNDWTSWNTSTLTLSTTDTTNGHTLIFNLDLACTAPGSIDTPAYGTANAYTTITIGGGASSGQTYQTSTGNLSGGGCAANSIVHFKLTRVTDTVTDTQVNAIGNLEVFYNGGVT